jgi:UDP-N-acetylglucosamine 1-carboxyvinyltransferase
VSKFIVRGGKPLNGKITACGNKNAVLPMIAASLLTTEEVVLENVPDIRDVASMLQIASYLGADVKRDRGRVTIHAASIEQNEVPWELCEKTRTSFLFVAPLLFRTGRTQLYPPGGDHIGRRRLDPHFYGLRLLGAEVDEEEFEFDLTGTFIGKTIFFDQASVTATEHVMMAAAVAEGKTRMLNAASEPHVQDLAKMLNSMGAQIDGIGTNTLTIVGVAKLHGTRHRVVSDHIEAVSYLALAAATGGSITINDTVRSHYWMAHRVFERLGVTFSNEKGRIVMEKGQVPRVKPEVGRAIPMIDDGPWPQFPSDMMSVMLVLATQSEGTVLFFEKMFESRLYFVDPLIQMGANIVVCDPHRVIVTGKTRLRGQTVRSPDIRAGMALVIAALCSHKRPCVIQNAEVVDRGYPELEKKLRSLGADIVREPD